MRNRSLWGNRIDPITGIWTIPCYNVGENPHCEKFKIPPYEEMGKSHLNEI